MKRREFIRVSASTAAAMGFRVPSTEKAPGILAGANPREINGLAKLADVNTTSITSAIQLGCEAMSHSFNPIDTQVGAPLFWINLRPRTYMNFSAAVSDAQVPGRHLAALLAAERHAGISIDPRAVEKHAAVAYFSFSGPVTLPLNRANLRGRVVNFMPVNVAHGLHALYALARYRNESRAHELFEASIAAIRSHWTPEKGWDVQRLEALGLNYRDGQPDAPFIAGLAMAIGPLAKYHRETGSRSALELATALKEKVVAECFVESGEYDPDVLGRHVHNVAYVMASLAWLATVTKDTALMGRVKKFYNVGLRRLRNSIGWTPEFSDPAAAPTARPTGGDRGEAGNTALILETALLLGDAGDVSAYADAELMIRSHLLPSQFRDVSFVEQPANPDGIVLGDVPRTVRGSWGLPAPYGHQPAGESILGLGEDVVGTVVAALVEAHTRIAVEDRGAHAVNFLFDFESQAIKVSSPYSRGAIEITVREPGPVMVRIPPWVVPDSIVLTGAQRAAEGFPNGYLQVAPVPNEPFSIRFPLTERELDVSHGSMSLRARVRGDQVIAMQNRGTDLTFFDPLPASLAPAAVLAEAKTTDAQQPESVDGAQSHVYKSVRGVHLRLHVFRAEKSGRNSSTPAIIFFFGGGWTQGSVTQFAPQARHFAQRGMTAILSDYRVSARHATTPFESMADAKSAVRWVRSHAANLGIDPDRIVAAGGSSGGHIAVSSAVFSTFDELGEDTSLSSAPNALVLFNPAVNTAMASQFGTRGEEGSPFHQMRRRIPPTLILHGVNDTSIPIGQVELFCARAEELGSQCRVVKYDGAGHGFFNSQVSGRWYRETLAEVDGFLTSLGYLAPPSTSRRPF